MTNAFKEWLKDVLQYYFEGKLNYFSFFSAAMGMRNSLREISEIDSVSTHISTPSTDTTDWSHQQHQLLALWNLQMKTSKISTISVKILMRDREPSPVKEKFDNAKVTFKMNMLTMYIFVSALWIECTNSCIVNVRVRSCKTERKFHKIGRCIGQHACGIEHKEHFKTKFRGRRDQCRGRQKRIDVEYQ